MLPPLPSDDALPKSEKKLFRTEVFEHRNGQFMGTVKLAQPISNWIIVAVASVISCAALCLLFLGDITKKTRVVGVTVAASGSVTIVTPVTGILGEHYVKDGQHVKKGDKLFEISTTQNGRDGELSTIVGNQLIVRQQALDSEYRARLTLLQNNKSSLIQRLATLSAEEGHLSQEIVLADKRRALARGSLDMYKNLQKDGFVSILQMQQKQEELIDLDSRFSSLERAKLQLTANKQILNSERESAENSEATDKAQLSRTQAALSQEIAENRARGSYTVIATQTGRVNTLIHEAGQFIAAGQALGTLIPDSGSVDSPDDTVVVQLFAPSRSTGFISPGQTVLIRYDAYPYQKFGLQRGVISEVSETPLTPDELPSRLANTVLLKASQAGGGNEALYRIRVKIKQQFVKIYGHRQPLKPEMTLQADIIQDRRKIWEWIAEPLLGAVQN